MINRRQKPLPPRPLLLLLTLGATLAIGLQFHTLLGRDAGVSLLVVMLALKLLELHTQRDAMLAIFLGYFVIAGQFFFTQEIPVAVYMVLAILLITAALIGLSGHAERLPIKQRLKTAAALLAQSLPMMLVLFLLFPRLPGPIWALPKDSTTGMTGLSDRMAPGQISLLIQSNKTAFRVVFDGEIPPPEERYWRGPVLAQYDGRSWNRPDFPPHHIEPLTGTRSISYTITLEPSGQRWLLALEHASTVPANAQLNAAYEMMSVSELREVRQYRMTSVLDATYEPELNAWARARALQLPEDTAPRARALAQGWFVDSDTPQQIVERALTHFRTEPFFYSLEAPLLADDPVDQFLFETRTGFCEHYASSFVVLMRAAGVPARVVTGYLGGEINNVAGYMLVRQADAHAWAEVWIEGEGWVRVDPTAAIAPERVLSGVSAALGDSDLLPAFIRASYGTSWLNQLSMAWDSVNYYWNDWVLSFGPEKQRELLEKLGLGKLGWEYIVILLFTLLGAMVALYMGYYWWRMRPLPQGDAERLLTRLEAFLARAGIERAPHEPVTLLAARVAQQRREWKAPVGEFLRDYQRARYGEVASIDWQSHARQLANLAHKKETRRKAG